MKNYLERKKIKAVYSKGNKMEYINNTLKCEKEI